MSEEVNFWVGWTEDLIPLATSHKNFPTFHIPFRPDKEVNVFLQGPVAPFPVEQVKSLIALLSLSDRYEIAGKESENLVFTFTPR